MTLETPPPPELEALFRQADARFLNAKVSELDSLAYAAIKRFFDYTDPLTPYGVLVASLCEPEYNYHYEKSLIADLAREFPPLTAAKRAEVAAATEAHNKLKHELYEKKEERTKLRTKIKAREKQSILAQANLAKLDPASKQAEAIAERMAEHQTDIEEAKAEITLVESAIAVMSPEVKQAERKKQSLERNNKDHSYGRDSLILLKNGDKRGQTFRDTLKSDWAFITNWLDQRAERSAPKNQITILINLEKLCNKLSISDSGRRVLEHMVLCSHVPFYKKFVDGITYYDRGDPIALAKLCGVAPSEITLHMLGESELAEKGLIATDSSFSLNKRNIQTLSTAGLSENDILRRLAGIPAAEKSNPAHTWDDIVRTQGPGAEEVFIQLSERRKRTDAPPATIFIYGDKGAGKTQGAIKAALAAGYDNAVIAHEFDEHGQALSYAQRLANIRIALAVGKSIPGFALIVDEIDKLGGDKGALDSIALLRLFEDAGATVIATANNEGFSEAFKDRFQYSARFHVPVSERRAETFFNMAAGRLPDLKENEAAYRRLLMETEVLPRAMVQAIDNAVHTGRGIEAVRRSFAAKAELMTGTRSGLKSDIAAVNIENFAYFNGRIHGHPNLTVDGLFQHVRALPAKERGIITLLGGTRPHVEIASFVPALAEALKIGVLWTSLKEFSSDDELERSLSKASDMKMLTAVRGAEELTAYGSQAAMDLLAAHDQPVVFLASTNRDFDVSARLYNHATFVIDCQPPSPAQCSALCRKHLGLEVEPGYWARMPDITEPVFQITQAKMGKVLPDFTDRVQTLALLRQVYDAQTSGYDALSVFAEWHDPAGSQPQVTASLGGQPAQAGKGSAHPLGPVFRF